MNDLLPMSELTLKKRFLKVLYEELKKGNRLDFRAILMPGIPRFFGIKPLLKSEFEKGIACVYELQRDGYIRLTNEINKYMLTEKGIKTATRKIHEMRIPNVDLADLLIERHSLLNKVYSDYILGNYENAIFNAYKELEEKVRKKASLAPSDIGTRLMDKAFKPDGGKLTHPSVKVNAEQEGIHFLMRGAISFFKNPSSHRTVDWDDPHKAIEILTFAKFLLDLVDQCQLNTA